MGAILKSKLVRWLLAPIALLWALGWGYIQYQYPTCTFRYKLTAEVMTPDGLRTGSSVVEVSYSNFASLSGVPNLIVNATGEAMYIDLGNGKNLFLMLTNRVSGRNLSEDYQHPQGALDALKLPLKVLNLHWKFGDQSNLKAKTLIAKAKGTIEVPFVNLPTLVVFRDLAIPDSVAVIQPDGLSKIHGNQYQLKNVKLEITDDLPQPKIETILPWLANKKIEWDNKSSFGVGDTLITQLFYDSFKQPYTRGKRL